MSAVRCTNGATISLAGLELLPDDDNHLVTHWCGDGVVDVRDGRPMSCGGCRIAFDSDHVPFEGEFTVWAKETEIA